MSKKDLWKSDILSKDAGRCPTFLLKMSLFHRSFSNILLAKTNYLVLPGEILVKNGLIVTLQIELIVSNCCMTLTHLWNFPVGFKGFKEIWEQPRPQKILT